MALRHGSRRRETFYKVQKWNDRIAAWVDARKKTFDTLQDAQDFANGAGRGLRTRILQYHNGEFTEMH